MSCILNNSQPWSLEGLQIRTFFMSQSTPEYKIDEDENDDDDDDADDDDLDQQPQDPHSFYDASTDWRDWVKDAEYANPWSNKWLKPLTNEKVDPASRHLIYLLQYLYRTGKFKGEDRVTTTRCNHLLDQLAGEPHRAFAIWQCMELFRGFQTKFFEPPVPTIKTYYTVLRIHGESKSETPDIAEQASAIIQAMKQRARAGEEQFEPETIHTNRVLQAWTNTTFWERSSHAAKAFLRYKHDPESFLYMFRACTKGGSKGANLTKQKQLGALVAIKIWEDFVRRSDDLDIPAGAYAHFLEAVRELPLDHPHRFTDIRKCLDRAIAEGKVNREVIFQSLVCFLSNRKLRETYYGQFTLEGDPRENDAATQLIGLVPTSWKVNATGNSALERS
jgi:hypothetical protein